MIVSIHQPHYLPWLRYVDKIARSDVFVLLDDVQYTKNGWQNRNKIKGAQGWMYVTVPVLHAFGKAITEVRINNQERWRARHWGALRNSYAKAPYFRRYGDLFEMVYGKRWETLNELNVHLLGLLFGTLGITTPIVRNSQLGVLGAGTERLVGICTALGATAYLSGDYAATNHLDLSLFKAQGIEVCVQGWQCPKYEQQYMQAGFISDLSIVDLLFNEGDKSGAILASNLSKLPLPAT